MTADPGAQPAPTAPPDPPGPTDTTQPLVAIAPPTPPMATANPAGLLVPLVVGGAVSVVLGVYGRVHTPTGVAVDIAGFSGPQTVKVWLATGAVTFALLQLLSALVMYGRVPGLTAPGWTGTAHRWSGRAAFLLAVPVAMHCLYALGFQSFEPRVLVHSLLGCVFFGAFTAKMLVLPRRGLPGWALPLLGGVVFAGLVGVWLTSALWFFANFGVKL
jgi:uncharacterized protein DUF6529